MQSFINKGPVIHPEGFVGQVSTQGLLEERSLYACSPVAVQELGGPLARAALGQIRQHYEFPIRNAVEKGLSAVCDVRVHRLFEGQFPCIPGWHCDFVPRGAYSGQPNFSIVHPYAFHVCVLLSDSPTGVSNTEFVDQPLRIQVFDHEHVYKNVHAEVERMKPVTRYLSDGRFCWFDQKTIHRGKATHHKGVRMFMRFSMIEKPVLANQVAKQVQVYQLNEGSGW